MELWIRSQDKRCLMKADRLDIDLGNGAYKIYLGGFATLVGIYKTYPRAKQIIDEIQNLLQPRYFIKDSKIDFDNNDFLAGLSENIVLRANQQIEYDLKQAGQIVYTMPEE